MTLSPQGECYETSCPTLIEDRLTLENATFEPRVQALADNAITACRLQDGCALECKYLIDFAEGVA